MKTMKEEIQEIVRNNWSKMPAPEQSVLWCICEAYELNKSISQGKIASHERFLGAHPKHEKHLKSPESTKRQIRQLVRNLRVNHNVPILSSNKGYKLPISREELNDFVKDLERTARAQAASWYETYKSVRKHCDTTSSFLDQLGNNK